ncbi:MAG: hypothetical protein HYZ07_01035 [Candidatus Harrisonbacteria bacterium]|nr:hypothetical protein [Candidatus Harrisonbacteria bacterium]
MVMAFIGFTLDAVGKILVSYTVIMVHYRFWKEHKIDERVFATMQRERIIAILGVILIIIGYLLQIPSKL